MKRNIRYILLIAFVCFIGNIYSLWYRRSQTNASIQRMPNIALMCQDSTVVLLRELTVDSIPTVILYFHPECEFCNMEIEELNRGQDELKGVQLLLITAISLDEIEQVVKVHPFDVFNLATIVCDYRGLFAETFHIKAPPAFFIYDKTQQLKKAVRGITPVKTIKQYLQ